MDRASDERVELLRDVDRRLHHAFYDLMEAGDALMDARFAQQSFAVHGMAAQAAAWRQYVEREMERIDGRD